MGRNDDETLVRQVKAGALTWRGPTLMLFCRSACAVAAQALVAAIFALRSSPTPWHDWPFSLFETLLYLRLRRLIPFAIAHALMDGASVVFGVLLPQLRA